MQERAARTRQAVLEAAADEFAERGYEGASLQRMGRRAATSIGALTFHFGNKTTLAEEVRTTGRARFERCLEDLAAAPDPLRQLRTLIGALARMAHEDAFVRATRRLEADGPGDVSPLTEVWLPVLRGLLDRAHDARKLRPGVSPEDAVALLAHLAEGAMAAHGAARDSATESATDSARESARDSAPESAPDSVWDSVGDSVWNVVLHGLAADRTGRADGAAGQADGAGQAGRAEQVGRAGQEGLARQASRTCRTDMTDVPDAADAPDAADVTACGAEPA
ncbi:TetR family transcriptional regulator [Streptomyces sp. CA-278952]|uniref:TetR family transcriptional regulator n=1 Tax=Streptomyces sp. CA-278952 TaxID=2980556 RepID=UPI002368B47A|nr:TetR family transcriptional regulator [Streptomyces sp. CA-278952]WDG29784.1 TetR family transcriptional regulator [Streptomyces sp. CA-278952]